MRRRNDRGGGLLGIAGKGFYGFLEALVVNVGQLYCMTFGTR